MPESKGATSSDTGIKKTLSVWNFFTIGFGAVIDTGWMLLVGDQMVIGGGPIAAVIAFLIGAIFLLPIGAVFGEPIAAIPMSGGIIKRIDRTYGNNTSYITGWFLALGNGTLCPRETITVSALVSDIFGGLFPTLGAVKLCTIMGAGVYLFPTVIALGFTSYVISPNFRGASATTELQAFLTKVLFAGMLLAMDISSIKGGLSSILSAFSRTTDPSSTTNANNMFTRVISVLVITPFFCVGFGTIPQQAERAAEGLDWDKFGKVISVALLAAGGFYIICIYSLGTIIPWTEFMQNTVPALACLKNINIVLHVAILVIATLGPTGPMNSFRRATSRVILAMGRKEQLPSPFAEIDGRSGAPKMADMVLAVLTVVEPFLGKDMLVSLTNVSALAFIFSCTMVSFACLKTGKTEPDLPRPYKVPSGKPDISMACLAGNIIIALMVIPFSPAALKPIEWAIVAGWLAIGLTLRAVSSEKSA